MTGSYLTSVKQIDKIRRKSCYIGGEVRNVILPGETLDLYSTVEFSH
jgi:hypothetical protein